jgi:hypothetical protein
MSPWEPADDRAVTCPVRVPELALLIDSARRSASGAWVLHWRVSSTISWDLPGLIPGGEPVQDLGKTVLEQ